MVERFDPVDFDWFHTEELPRLAAERLSPVGGLCPLAFRLEDGRAYTLVPTAVGLRIEPGEGRASTVVELSERDWCNFRWELQTCFALLYADRLRFRRGGMGQLSRWEPVLRFVIDGQDLYDLDAPDPVVDDAGRPLELTRSFSPEDSDDVLRDFLFRAGFLHLRGVFQPDEIEALRAVVERAVAEARPDDRLSWWTTVDGRELCSRVNYLDRYSEMVAALGDDPRLLRVADLAGVPLRDARDRLDGNGVVIKVPGADSGLADLPWHRDCGMGGHPVKCPLLNVGIQLDPATAGSGQLQMIAGSHRGTSPLPAPHQVAKLPVVALTTEPGDVTVHWGHTLHAAPPPEDRRAHGRRALYVTYVPPLAFEMMGPGEGYNDVLFTRDAGRVRHVAELRR